MRYFDDIKEKLNKDGFCLLVNNRNPYIANAGTEKYIQIQTDILSSEMDVLVIFPVTKKYVFTIYGWGVCVNRKFIGVTDEKTLVYLFGDILKSKNCMGVFLHHLKWCDTDSLSRILSFTDHIVFYVHDYYTCCIQPNLLKNDEIYCGGAELSETKCSDCVYYKESIEHRIKMGKLFKLFDKVDIISPSKIAGDIWSEAYKEYADKISVIDHLIVETLPGKHLSVPLGTNKINVAFVGLGDRVKGWDLWKEALAGLSEEEHSEYNFYHFGQVFESLDNVKKVEVSISRDGPEAMTDKLIEYGIDSAVLYSIWPETYSYTYFEAMKAGCYIITNNCSGNIACQVEKNSNGIVLECTADSLKDLFRNPEKLRENINRFRYGLGTCDVNIAFNADFTRYLNKTGGKEAYQDVKASKMQFAGLADILYRIRYRKELIE